MTVKQRKKRSSKTKDATVDGKKEKSLDDNKKYDADKYSKSNGGQVSTKKKSGYRRKVTGKDMAVFLTVFSLIVGGALYPYYRQFGITILLGQSWNDYGKSPLEWRKYLDDGTKSIVLIGGPHRGGTTIIWDTLSRHPNIVGFGSSFETGVSFSEGILFQDVYPRFGVGFEAFATSRKMNDGMGQYALLPEEEVHLTSSNPLLQHPTTLSRIMNRFAPYWDRTLSRKKQSGDITGRENNIVLAEKSPPNAVLSTFLEGLYNMPLDETWGNVLPPGETKKKTITKFLFITRHPIANALAVQKGTSGVSLETIIRNHIQMHKYMRQDEANLSSPVLWVRLEDFARHPQDVLDEIFTFLNVPSTSNNLSLDHIHSNPNAKYYKPWCESMDFETRNDLVEKYNNEIKSLNLGYDLTTFCDAYDEF